VRPYQPLPENYIVQMNDDFSEIVYALINDALDLLPDKLKVMIGGDDSIDEIMVGIENPGPKTKPSFSTNKRNLGAQVAYVTILVFGVNARNAAIPQSIYYDAIGPRGDVNKRIDDGLKQLAKSDSVSRDRYNLALNLVVDLWFKDFNEQGLMMSAPTKGVYLRDSNNNLYLYEGNFK
jgi:hypothetical protein